MVVPSDDTDWVVALGGGTEGNTGLGGGTRAPATAAGGASLRASWLGGGQVACHPGVYILGKGSLGPDFLSPSRAI